MASLEITEQSDTVEFELKKGKYKLTISNNSNKIKFKIEDLLSMQKDEYILQTNLKELQNINRFFLLFLKLPEVSQSLIKLVKNGNIDISKEANTCKFKVKNPINDDEFYLELKKVQNDDKGNKQDLQDSIPLVSDLRKRIDVLETQNKEFEKRIESLEQKFENVKNIEKKVEVIKVGKGKREENDDEDEEEDDGKQLFKSNIIDKKNERAIKKFVQGKLLSTELLYDSARDGDSIDAFKSKCYGQSPTLLIVKTDIGVILGGYATTQWKDNGPLPDYNSFVYSLNPNKKFSVTMPKYALFGCDVKENILFQFGCVCFRVLNNCTKTSDNVIRGSGYEKGFIDVIQGDHKFKVSRIEVFKLNF